MLNIAPRSTIVARFEMSEVLKPSRTDLVRVIMGYGMSLGIRVQTVQEGESWYQVYYDQWFTRHLPIGLCYLLHMYKTTPSNKAPDLLTVQLANPQEASQGLPVIALWAWAPLRMLFAGAIGQWNFLLLRIWKWGKLIWNEICISTLAGKLLLPTISSLD